MSSPSNLPQAWLQRRITADDPRFRQMLGARELLPGEELWFYRSDRGSWDNLAGRMGYVILRDGAVVDHVGMQAMS